MDTQEKFLVFGLNGNRFAIPLTVVQRVVRAVAITPVPEAPAGVRGVINVAGQIVPVIDLRRLLNVPEASLRASDYFLMVRNNQGPMALLVNEVLWIIERGSQEIIPAESIFPGLKHFQGALKVGEEIVLLHDFALDALPGALPVPDCAQV